MWLVHNALPVTAPGKAQSFSQLGCLFKVTLAVIVGIVGDLAISVYIHFEVKIKGDAPLVLGPVTAAFCVGHDVAWLCAALSIKSVLLRYGAKGFTDGYADAFGGTGFDPGAGDTLQAWVA